MDDATILGLYWERSEQALRETEAAYGRKLFRLSNRILNCREDAEECVSDTYLETWQAIPPQRPRCLYAFLAAICRNLSLNRLDWNLAAKRHGQVVALTQEMSLCIPDTRQDSVPEGRELRRILEAFLEGLPQESRLMFLRRYLYVDTMAEIAARYGISESKVKTQLHRTRTKLYNALAKEGIRV